MNLFELFVKVGVDDQASGKLKDLGGKLGKGLKTAAKIGTAAVGAAAAGITALTTAAVKNYAEYEQLVGGVETLFKKSSDTVMKYASEAYRSAGMSANEYMSTVTGFSASLLQGLGGDTQKAAEIANLAVTDMADNANKMGTSMEMIQNAYQGFAKDNFTMLDNLKLGYGGTAGEMARLINDSGVLGDAIEVTNKTVSQVPFNKVIEAINVIQKRMGITGTTAKEAGRTISGSVGAMKSAWTNLVTSLSDKNADISKNIEDLITTIAGDGTENNLGVIGNILPAVETALDGAVKLIEELFPKIIDALPGLITTLLPSVANGALNIVKSFVRAISDNGDLLVQSAIDAIMTLTKGLLDMLPKILEVGLQLVISLTSGIAEALPKLIPTIVDTINFIVDKLTAPEMLKELLNAALELVLELAKGIVDALPELIDAAVLLINNLIDFILDEENLNAIIDAAVEIILKLSEGLEKAIPQLVDAAILIIEKLCDFFLEPENIKTLGKMALRVVKAIGKALINSAWALAEGVGKLIAKIFEIFTETDWLEIGKNIVEGIHKGMKNSWSSLTDWVGNSFNGLVGGVKDFLGIHSPSRVFAGIGKNMALGVGEGWEDTFGDVQDDINGSMDFGEADYGITTSSTSIGDFGGGSTRYGYGGSQNVNVTVGIDDSANAMGLARALLPFLKIAEKEVYA